MADIRYYGNVMTTRWRLYVTMETLCQQQDGDYALLWERYPNIQITYCLWGWMISEVYKEKANTRDELVSRIMNSADLIK